MKKSSIISIVFLFISTMAFADDIKNHQAEQVIMKGKNHFSQWDIPADMPDVFYNSEAGTITIVDYANVTYNPISLIRIYGRTAFVLNRLPQWGRSHSNYGKPSVAARCQKKGCYAMKRLEKSIYLSA